MEKKKNTRKALSKKIRFEVFKRDSFQCQYCGQSAPNVLLHIDHIKPVSKGGTNEILNLITACEPCNLGKRDKELTDHSTISKQREQLQELQERREQLEMMMSWREGLREFKQDTVNRVCEYWHGLAPGYTVNENGRNNIKTWIKKFSLNEVLHAMDVAAESYLQFEKGDETVTSDSWENAFAKIPGICTVTRQSQEDPEIKDLYYIRGIARNNCPNYFDNNKAIHFLKVARSWDVPMEELRSIALRASSWTSFRNGVFSAIDERNDENDQDSGRDDETTRNILVGGSR